MEKEHFLPSRIIILKACNLYIAIAFLIFITACSKDSKQHTESGTTTNHKSHKWSPQLVSQIEAFICEYPDSALELLHSVSSFSHLSTEERAWHALLSTQAEYAKQQTLNDSTLNIAYTYYVIKKKGNEEKRILTLLFQGISFYNKEKYDEALKVLLQVNEKVDLLKHPYIKGVIQFYLGMIYNNNGLHSEAHNYFKKEFQYTLKTDNVDFIANSAQHYAISFLYQKMPDSASFYMKHSLQYANQLDSFRLSMIYHNIAFVQQRYFPENISFVEEYMLKSLSLGNSLKDSIKSYAILAEHYYNTHQKERADCLIQSIKGLSNDTEILNTIYEVACNYYDKEGPVDTAYIYLKKYMDIRLKRLSEQQTQNITEIKAEYEFRSKAKTLIIWGIALFAILLIIILILLISWMQKRLQEKRLLEEIVNYGNQLEKLDTQLQQLANDKQELQNQKSGSEAAYAELKNKLLQLDTTKQELENRKAQSEKEQDALQAQLYELNRQKQDRENERHTLKTELQRLKNELSKVEHTRTELEASQQTTKKLSNHLKENIIKEISYKQDIKLLYEQIEKYQILSFAMLSRFYFRRPSASFDQDSFTLLLDSYAQSTTKRENFIKLLRQPELQLSERDLFICVLFHENCAKGQDMPFILGASSDGAYRTAKNKLKTKLINSRSTNATIIKLIEQLS